jgi:dipeptidyl aminopeptidase/acylaminoacyl peptidase
MTYRCGGGDLRDILAGIRQVVATHSVDDQRVGIAGWSYGGYMAMGAVTRTERFRAVHRTQRIVSWFDENMPPSAATH